MKMQSHKPRSMSSDLPKDKVSKRQTKEPQAVIPVWTGPDYPRIAPGQYTATAVRIISPQFIRRWRRFSIGVCFRPFAEPEAEIVCFMNLDADMNPKRGGEFYRAWTRANGERPAKGQPMDPNVFLEGQIYEIDVVDAGLDSEGKQKSDAEVYSKVRRIVSVLRNGGTTANVVPIHSK